MKPLKVLYLVGVVFCSLFWTVGAVAGERVLLVKLIELQSWPNSENVLDKLTVSTGLPPVQRQFVQVRGVGASAGEIPVGPVVVRRSQSPHPAPLSQHCQRICDG